MSTTNNIHTSQKGFTIIELLIATSVFSIVLLLVTTGIIRMGNSYYKNIISTRTQEATRSIGEDISRSIQLANAQKRDVAGQNKFCIGDTRYVYAINQKVGDPGAIGITSEKISPSDECSANSGPNAKELLGANMRLLRFKVDPDPAGQTKTWKVDIRVAYGDNDLLTPYKEDGTPNNPSNLAAEIDGATCKSGIPGGSFCATAQLDTLVKRRLNTL